MYLCQCECPYDVFFIVQTKEYDLKYSSTSNK